MDSPSAGVSQASTRVHSPTDGAGGAGGVATARTGAGPSPDEQDVIMTLCEALRAARDARSNACEQCSRVVEALPAWDREMAAVLTRLARVLERPTNDRSLLASAHFALAVACFSAGFAHMAFACACQDEEKVSYAAHTLGVGIQSGMLCELRDPDMQCIRGDVLSEIGVSQVRP